METPDTPPVPNSPLMAGCQQEPCSATRYGPVRKLLGFYYIVGIDREGWWVTDKKGYKSTMNAALTKVTAPDGGIARQVILGRWMLMLVSP